MNLKGKCKLNMEKIKCKVNFILTVLFILCSKMQVYADADDAGLTAGGGKFQDSKFVTGTQTFLKDLGGMLLILAPLLGAVIGVYLWIRKGAADEQDQKKWDNRLIIVVIAVIGAMVFGGIVTTVTGYYK